MTETHIVNNYLSSVAFTFIGAALVVLGDLFRFRGGDHRHTTLEQVSADFNVLVKSDTDEMQEELRRVSFRLK